MEIGWKSGESRGLLVRRSMETGKCRVDWENPGVEPGAVRHYNQIRDMMKTDIRRRLPDLPAPFGGKFLICSFFTSCIFQSWW